MRRISIGFSVAILLFILLASSLIGAAPSGVVVVRSIDKEEVAPGDELRVNVNISTGKDVTAVIVTEKLPSGFEIIASNPSFAKHDPAVGEVDWLFINRTGVENVTITYTVEVSINVSESVYHIGGSWSALGSEGIFHGESPSTEVRVEKLESTLSLSVSPLRVKVDETITILGALSPTRPNVNITLTYVKPDGSIIERTVKTSSDGGFADTYRVDAVGSWSVTASWLGDLRYKAVESQKVLFSVEPLIEQWLIYASIVTVTVSILGIAVFLRKRRRSEAEMMVQGR